MIILPAMDLIGGKAVRLQQGRFDAVTTYPTQPLDALRQFAAAGANWAHIVDLDGAKAGRPVQADLVCKLAGSTPLSLQVAGGYRSRIHAGLQQAHERPGVGRFARRQA